MKNVLLTALASLALVVGFQNAEARADAPAAADVKISFDNLCITVQGKMLNCPCELDLLLQLLGPYDRMTKLSNWIVTWDDLGIIAYCLPETTIVHSVAVCLAEKDYKFWAKSTYSGKVSLDGVELKVGSTIGAINLAKKGKPMQELIANSMWGIEDDKVLVAVQLLEEEKSKTIDSVSISQKDPKKKKE